jgi:hypothetical protein
MGRTQTAVLSARRADSKASGMSEVLRYPGPNSPARSQGTGIWPPHRFIDFGYKQHSNLRHRAWDSAAGSAFGSEIPGLSSHSQGPIAVAGLPGLTKVAVRNWLDHFTFIAGDHRYLCRSSLVMISIGQTTVMLINIMETGWAKRVDGPISLDN